MSDLFASGRVIDLILVIVALEALGLTLYHRATGRGVAAADFLANLASGACLLLAARLSLTGQPWHLIALALAGSFIAHLLDLSRRWAARPKPRSAVL